MLMAYLIGLVDEDEKKELERRGWELEDPPAELVGEHDKEMVMVWVDQDLFKIMDGPDWEKG
jgi:hypothetical protein